MKNLMIAFSFLCLLLSSCTTGVQKNDGGRVDVNVEEFKAKMNDSNVVILDVRTPEETAQGKIKGAIEIDVKQNGFEDKFKELDKSKTYLVYCRSGGRSVKACGVLEEQGFKDLYNLKGGFTAWQKQ